MKNFLVAKEDLAQKILNRAGITINGDKPYDIQIKNNKFYKRVFSYGTLGLGEAYMDGWWEAEKLDEFFYKAIGLRANHTFVPELLNWRFILFILKHLITNAGARMKAFNIGKNHYDIGNDLFELMLDKRMIYSCGYWKNAHNLDEAQEAKLDLICQKLHLKPGMRVLDIGCGWGGLAEYMARKYSVEVVGITVSEEQAKYARRICKNLPVEIKLCDYRDLKGKFDRVVSIGMFEHVGRKNYRRYMRTIWELLKDEGLFLLHTIGGNISVYATDPWIDKYIFPGGMLPSIKQISASIERLFVMEDWHNFGADYDKTLMAWFENFDRGWSRISEKYGERFYRMWKYYLLFCAGFFRLRQGQLWQIILSKKGVKGGYESIR